ncbi:hypothetical protein LUZ60_016647 [Juncus effusus]|nr:hypothetical protein LUZ60_016647 [Juncus effusus]
MALKIRVSLSRQSASSSWKKRRKREDQFSIVPSLTRSHLNMFQQNSLFKSVRDKMRFCFGASSEKKKKMDGAEFCNHCVFCDIARGTSSTTILYSDDKVVVFPDRNPSAFRHYLAIPVKHVPTVNNLERKAEDYQLVNHMLNVGKDLLKRDAPNSEEHRFGFHQPPFNSINHLHLHCLALPFTPAWRHVKYTSLGRFGGFIESEKLLEKIKPPSTPF